MNLRALTLASGIALAAALTPAAAIAQNADRGATHPRISSASSQRPIAPATSRTRTPSSNTAPGRTADRWHHDRDDRWNYRPRYVSNFYGGYPYYGYPFYGGYPYYGSGFSLGIGYGFGYGGGYGYGYPGYGYGYPYYGSSAATYYNAPAYRGTGSRSEGGSVVAQVQRRLARDGYYRGRIDGVIGDATRSAIRAYERANGLRVDGRINQDLLSRMGVR